MACERLNALDDCASSRHWVTMTSDGYARRTRGETSRVVPAPGEVFTHRGVQFTVGAADNAGFGNSWVGAVRRNGMRYRDSFQLAVLFLAILLSALTREWGGPSWR